VTVGSALGQPASHCHPGRDRRVASLPSNRAVFSLAVMASSIAPKFPISAVPLIAHLVLVWLMALPIANSAPDLSRFAEGVKGGIGCSVSQS
jgi:hypothetical protein